MLLYAGYTLIKKIKKKWNKQVKPPRIVSLGLREVALTDGVLSCTSAGALSGTCPWASCLVTTCVTCIFLAVVGGPAASRHLGL